MTITPIPTEYAGTSFKSRLEAGYAATFDSLGLPWHYEPQSHALSDGQWYHPDFYLPTARAWVEVKGDHDERISKVKQFAADLWEQAGQPEWDSLAAPMVILARSPVRWPDGLETVNWGGVGGPDDGYFADPARWPPLRSDDFHLHWCSGLPGLWPCSSIVGVVVRVGSLDASVRSRPAHQTD
jgi:hypothetical protein